jgi:NADH-quinone oxidoreductase subunit L
VYWWPHERQDELPRRLKPFYLISYRKFGIDEVEYGLVVATGKFLSSAVDLFDRYIIDGIVGLIGRVVYLIGLAGKYTQTGQVQTYGMVAAIGVFLIVAIAMIHVGGVF